MNMNMKMNIKLDPKMLLKLLQRFRTLLVLLAIIGLCGYTLYQISLITAVSPDETTVAAQEQQVNADHIKFDTVTIKAIGNQTQINPSTSLSNLGKTDPFYQ
jgi:hypothetical protein